MMRRSIPAFIAATLLAACLPPSDPYPTAPPAQILSEAQTWSDSLTAYIERWSQGLEGDSIPDELIPWGISDSYDLYLKHPDSVTAEETWATRFAKPIDLDSLYAGIPDPNVTYLFLGTALAPFGSKMIIEGEFPHARFFSIQVTPPLNGTEYYAQRQFGTAEVGWADVDIDPLPGHTNPFRIGADRNATDRGYRVEVDLTTGDPVALNGDAHVWPYRQQGNTRKGAMLVYQGPLGFKTVAQTPLPAAQQGPWNLGAVWIRIYQPDSALGPLGGVPMPKVWCELADGTRYFIGSNFTPLQARADMTIANRVTNTQPNPNFGPAYGWSKSWGVTRSILNGVCLSNGWSRADSAQRVREIDLGWTGRGEFQPAPGNYEIHATVNNYIAYLGRPVAVPPGHVAVLTGRMPTFPSTVGGEPLMTGGEVRYWSIIGLDQDPLSPLPATTANAIVDSDVLLDSDRRYVIAYSRDTDRPANATAANGVTWVNWGTQSELGLLMRWLNIDPEWTFPQAPQEHNLDWAHSDWAGSQYDSTLIGVNWRHGFMQCYLPRVHYMTTAEFEALGTNCAADRIPVWVDESTGNGPSEARLGTITASSTLDAQPVNAAVNAIDGDVKTAWSAGFGQQAAQLTVDLGAVRTISAVKLHWDFLLYGRDYAVQVSDDGNAWTTIATQVNGDGQIDLFKHLLDVQGRYVRVDLTAYSALYHRLLEFEVFTTDFTCDDIPTTVTDVASGTTFLLFPNPAQDVLFVDGADIGEQLRVFSAEGRLMLQQRITGPRQTVDLRDLPVGTYVLHMEGRGTQRFVKVR